MRNFFVGVWEGITDPFRFIFKIIAFPFQVVARYRKFINTEPEERPIADVFVDIATNKDTRQMLWDQIEAFRMHLLRALLGLILAVGVSFIFTNRIIDFLAIPAGGLDNLKAIEVTESISVFMRVALLSGVVLSVPYICFELWYFAAPGLKPRERKMGLAGIPLAAIFFVGGLAFTYYVMLPAALPFLINFMGIKTELRAQSYFSFVTSLMFWIGISFEFPLVIYVLTAIGLLQPKILAEQWKIAIVIISIVAAVITPTVDPINQALVMAPMILLYFVSIGLSYIAHAGRPRKENLEPAADQGGA